MPTSQRTTVNLTAKSIEARDFICETTGRTQTDAINWGLSLGAIFEKYRQDGYDLLVRNQETGEVEKITFV